MPKRLFALFRNLFQGSRVERDLDEELCSTVEMLTEEKVRRGVSEADARRQALMLLGGLEQVKEEVRSVHIGRLLDEIGKDVRYCLRTLRRDRVFAGAAVVTMALGIGALTSVFSLFNAALLQPLPYEGEDRLLAITDHGAPYTVSYPCYQRLRERSRTLSEVGLYLVRPKDLTIGDSRREPVNAAAVTASLLRAANTAIVRGRLFTPEEDRLGGPDLVIISTTFWRNKLAAHEDPIGKQINLNDIPHTIVGLLPDSYAFPSSRIDVWTPFHVEYGSLAGSATSRIFQVVASLRSGATIAQAQAEVGAIVTQIDKEFPDLPPNSKPLVSFYRDYVVGDFKAAFFILVIAGLFVMAIAIANVTNLFLIQAEKERRETAVKVALGAGNRRIMSEQVIKALLVSAAGSALGVVLAWWSIAYMRVLARQKIPRLAEATVGLKGVALAVGACIAAAAITAIFSAKRPSGLSAATCLSVSSMLSTRSRTRVRRFFVILEFGLALILMIGAGLMIRSLQNLLDIGLGFNPGHVLTFQPKLPRSLYKTNDAFLQYCRRLHESLRRLPGVLATGAASNLPFDGTLSQVAPVTVDRNQNAGRQVRSIRTNVSPGYFEAMGIPVVKGRTFAESDTNPAGEQAVIIDQALSRKFWPDADPIGKTLFLAANQLSRRGEPPPPTRWLALTVVGVVAGVTRHGVDTIANHIPNLPWEEAGQYYRPWGTTDGVFTNGAGSFAIRTQGDPIQLVEAVRREMKALDGNAAPGNLATMEDRWLDFSAERRFYMVVLNIFGLNALVLAAVGIYGVAAFSVAQRTHEIGVRIALGAGASQIFKLVAGEGLRLVGIGGAVGACAGFALSRFLKSMLFEVGERDAATFTTSIAVLVIAASFACYLPVRRATRLDPWTVLRVE